MSIFSCELAVGSFWTNDLRQYVRFWLTAVVRVSVALLWMKSELRKRTEEYLAWSVHTVHRPQYTNTVRKYFTIHFVYHRARSFARNALRVINISIGFSHSCQYDWVSVISRSQIGCVFGSRFTASLVLTSSAICENNNCISGHTSLCSLEKTIKYFHLELLTHFPFELRTLLYWWCSCV